MIIEKLINKICGHLQQDLKIWKKFLSLVGRKIGTDTLWSTYFVYYTWAVAQQIPAGVIILA